MMARRYKKPSWVERLFNRFGYYKAQNQSWHDVLEWGSWVISRELTQAEADYVIDLVQWRVRR